jgi:hypothetical protein
VSRQAKKKPSTSAKQGRQASGAEDKPRPGLPAPENVREVIDFVSPQKKRFKILRTTETDAYDPPLPPEDKPKP